MTIALVCSINSVMGQNSSMQILFGDPDDYAYKFGNESFEHKLPIHQDSARFTFHDYIHSISIDYRSHRVYYSNHVHGRLDYGMFVRKDKHTYYFDDVPDTNQVTKR